MYRVLIEGLEAYGYHGVPDEEQAIGHRYRVDLVLTVDGTADVSDAVEETVDYGEVAGLVKALLEGQKVRTVERLADDICHELLKNFWRIQHIQIRLVKRLPPLPHVVEQVGVELERSR